MKLDFWIDPACPWCWLTSRWITDIAPHRDIEVSWQPISLMVKNNVTPESPFFDVVTHTFGLLRVMEAVRAGEGDAALSPLYTAYGEHLHHQGDRTVTAATALSEAGLPDSYAAAYDDESWDETIHSKMAEGLALTGDDVGTPILGFVNTAGERVGFFGPVISRRLPLQDGLDLWDGLMKMATISSFWELKRTRTEGPIFDLPTA